MNLSKTDKQTNQQVWQHLLLNRVLTSHYLSWWHDVEQGFNAIRGKPQKIESTYIHTNVTVTISVIKGHVGDVGLRSVWSVGLTSSPASMFDQFRDSGWNTYYSDRPTPPEFDVTTAIISYLSVVLAATVIMIVVGTRGHEVQTSAV